MKSNGRVAASVYYPERRGKGTRPWRTLGYLVTALLFATGLSGSSFAQVASPIPIPRAARLVKGAMLAFYRLGGIPRSAGAKWNADRPGVQARVLRHALPRELSDLRAHWTGRALRFDLKNYGYSTWIGGQDFCCAAVRDVQVNSISSSGTALHVEVTESHRLVQMLPPGSFPYRSRRPLRWRGGWSNEWIHMTLVRKHGRYLAEAFTASWAEDFHG